jgi:hypothetical protein
MYATPRRGSGAGASGAAGGGGITEWLPCAHRHTPYPTVECTTWGAEKTLPSTAARAQACGSGMRKCAGVPVAARLLVLLGALQPRRRSARSEDCYRILKYDFNSGTYCDPQRWGQFEDSHKTTAKGNRFKYPTNVENTEALKPRAPPSQRGRRHRHGNWPRTLPISRVSLQRNLHKSTWMYRHRCRSLLITFHITP